MKRFLSVSIRSLLLSGMLLLMSYGSSYATHIFAMDLKYTWVSSTGTGSTMSSVYNVQVIVYGNCGSSVYPTIGSSRPVICVYNGATSVGVDTLVLNTTDSGQNVTQVCAADLDSTTCTLPTSTLQGTGRYIFSKNITLTGISTQWRFRCGTFTGTPPGRSSTITNIVSPGTSVVYLEDTLNNSTAPGTGHNSSPSLANLPTPYYCEGVGDSYSPVPTDPDGASDILTFQLVSARTTGGSTSCATVASNAGYMAGYSATQPIQLSAGTLSFSSTTGELSFEPTSQVSDVVYNIEERRVGILVGTCQREMTIIVQPCTAAPPSASLRTPSTGVLTDSNTLAVCSNAGAFTVNVDPVVSSGNLIYVDTLSPSGFPPGMTFSVASDSTSAPVVTIGWTTTGFAAGTYNFYLNYFINTCPVGGSSIIGYAINIDSIPGTISGNTPVCPLATITLGDTPTGGTWSSTSTTIATAGSATGVITGVAAGTSVITYTESPAQCTTTTIVTVNVGPAAITGKPAVCGGVLDTLSDATTGGSWSTTYTSIATVGPTTGIVTGVAAGTAIITYTMAAPSVCYDTALVNVAAAPKVISGSNDVCAGQVADLTDTLTGGSWTSSNTSIATIGSSTGVTGGVAGGTVTITYTMASGCTTNRGETVNPAPAVITGTKAVCLGATTTLTSTTTGGTWSSSSSGVATVGSTGIVTGITVGSAIITYSIPPFGCYDTTLVTVSSGAGTITGTLNVCVALTTALGDVTTGGTWSSTSTGIATVGSTGIVTGESAGTDTIKYSISGGCSTSAVVTVNAAPSAISPSTAVSLCIGNASTFSDPTVGGVWSSSNTAVATVGTGGSVTAVAAGTATISYTIGSCPAVKVVTVTAGGTPISPASATLCIGTNTTFTNTTLGGTWSSSNSAIATIGTGGIAGGVALGTATISYTLGTCSSTAPVTVATSPSAIAPSAAVSICTGSTTPFADVTLGGVWSSGNTAVATVGSTGNVTGVTAGTATISYTVGGCSVTKVITVNAGGSTLTPPTALICTGSSITLTAGTTGGAWSSSATTVATVGSTGTGTTATVTGLGLGTTTISYTIGTCIATSSVTVATGPAAISPAGGSSICTSGTVLLSDGVSGGIWSSTSTGVATVGSTGTVTGVSAGTTTISYSIGTCAVSTTVTVTPGGAPILPNGGSICIGLSTTFTDAGTGGTWSLTPAGIASITATGGSATIIGLAAGTGTLSYTAGTCIVTAPVTVSAAPAAITSTAPLTICTANTLALGETSSGGVWSSGSTSIATVGSTGIVTGVSGGVVTISYSIGGCAATVMVTVTPGAAAISPLAPSICTGNTLALGEAVLGGTWSSSNTAVATVGSTGIVTGITAGTSVISYSLGACGTSVVVTVGLSASAGTISGTTHTDCVGSTITLTESATGGTWGTSSPGIATVAGGIVGGVSGGVVTISYSVPSPCGTSTATYVVTVDVSSTAGIINGVTSMCAGTASLFVDTTFGGTWSVSPVGPASVSATGLVTGITPGTDTIIYTVSNSCGFATTKKVVTIGTFLSAGTITGPTSICGVGPITLIDATTGGVWSSGNLSIATVDGTGNVTGTGTGVDTISYTTTATCGTAVATHVVSVNALATAGAITGAVTICVADFTLFTETVSGGVWSASNGTASVSAGGVVTGMASGTDTISYTVTTSCGAVSATKVVTIIPSVSAGTITGPGSTICLGSSITLVDAAPGGAWTSSNGSAIVNSSGLVTGLAGGIDTISYTVASTCGLAAATYVITVNPTALTSGTITGPSTVCVSSVITLTDTIPGGVWSSSNANGTITTGGLVTGIIPGLDTITFTVTGACGIAQTTKLITIIGLPVPGAISGSTNICIGAPVTLSVTGTTGGAWSSGTSGIATVGSASGIVTGVTTGDDDITYTLTNACGTVIATVEVTVYPTFTVAPITGTMYECVGGNTFLSDATPGGVWSSSNGIISVVGAATGMVSGVTAGVDTIYYTATAVYGCTGVAMATNTVNTVPLPTPITGPTIICQGTTYIMSNVTPDGTWSSSNVLVATIDPVTGTVTGTGVGSAHIYYFVNNGCGTILDSTTMTVNPAPYPGVITAVTTEFCGATTDTLTDTTAGGVWSSSNSTVATVSSTGVAYGLAIGYDTIYYTLTNPDGCSLSASIILHVADIMPTVVFHPSGTATLCRGHFVNMFVTSSTSGGLTYQWKQDGLVIPGATNSTYSTYTSGAFSVVVNNGACNVTLTGTSVIMAPPNPVIAYTPPNILYTSSFVSYQWYLGWVPIPGDTTSLIHETANGVYNVVVTDINGCTDTSGQYSVVVVAGGSAGVNTVINAGDIKIYPNPATSVLNIDAPVKVDVSILSIDGKVLIEQNDASSINVSDLANGMYMIMVYDENKLLLKTAKFAKMK